MAVEIRELVIRVRTDDKLQTSQCGTQTLSAENQQQIIDECVRKVLDILATKKER